MNQMSSSQMSFIGSILSRWYVVGLGLAIVGILIGAFAFFKVLPGKPQIGVITIPFTVINEESAFVMTSYLEYARNNDRIKGVVIALSSPGGGAASSERLYIETRRLREEKPVIIIMNDLVASGGFMMAMGASHTFVKTSSLVGNVGVVSGIGPVLPELPPESVIFTGSSKLTGSTQRDWIGMMDLLKQSFARMVMSERGDKLRIPYEELVEGRLYAGMEAVQLGLVDEIGDDSAAVAKAATLAGVSNYELLDINVEVDRLFVQKVRRIFADPDGDSAGLDLATLLAIYRSPDPLPEFSPEFSYEGGPGSLDQLAGKTKAGPGTEPNPTVSLGDLRRFMLSGSLTSAQEDPLPGFPFQIKRPNIYYMYAGQNP
jgi:protease-4